MVVGKVMVPKLGDGRVGRNVVMVPKLDDGRVGRNVSNLWTSEEEHHCGG